MSDERYQLVYGADTGYFLLRGNVETRGLLFVLRGENGREYSRLTNDFPFSVEGAIMKERKLFKTYDVVNMPVRKKAAAFAKWLDEHYGSVNTPSEDDAMEVSE